MGRMGGRVVRDEQIIEYMRTRSNTDAPMGLTPRIMADVAIVPVSPSARRQRSDVHRPDGH